MLVPAKNKVITSGPIPTVRSFTPVPLNIRIFWVPSENRYKAEIKGRRVPIAMTPEDLRVLNEALASAAARVSKSIGSDLKVDTAVAGDALSELAHEGNNAFHMIFQDPIASSAIRDLINRQDTLAIEVQSENFFLPWELLYDGDPTVVRYKNFWGLRYIIARCIVRDMTSRGVPRPDLVTFGVPSIALQTDKSLKYVMSEEIPYFEGLSRNARIHLLKLRDLDPKNKAQDSKYFASYCHSKAVQISHFACHAQYVEKPRHHSYLKLSNDFCLSLRDIRNLQLELAGYPLVFLNACETGLRNPLQTLDFVSLFLSIGARGVIVTEADIPDRFAAQFVKHFYQSFLEGEGIGHCLLETRRHFLEEYDNPLGLIYGFYGDPSLHIKRVPVQEIVDQTHQEVIQ
jgi:hypothetical protein